jgi:antirestriction protein ArdC
MATTKSKFDVYQAVTDQILDALDHDIVPWRKPWTTRNGGNSTMHRNFVSKRAYRGINPFLLEVRAMTEGYTKPYWLTFNQAKAAAKTEDGGVRKGEKGTLVVLWKRIAFKPKKGSTCPKCGTEFSGSPLTCKNGHVAPEKVQTFILRHYKVFNVDQCDGLDLSKIEAPADDAMDETEILPIEAAEAIIANMPNAPKIRYGQDGAWYRPSADLIGMPDRSVFDSSEAFYSTEFHEAVHSTGHESRVNRKDAFKGSFGSPDYAREELTAEMGAAMLCAIAGIDNELSQSAAYIRHWMSKADIKAAIKNDKKLVVMAAARAQKACDYILNVNHQSEDTDNAA